MTVHPGALHLVARTLAEAIRPKPPLPFRKWLPKNIVLVDGPKKGERWSLDDAPYLGEIADCLSEEHPCNLVTVRKAQQTGVSILALAWCLYIAETCPDNVLYGVPGDDALKDINGQKMQPLIDAWDKETGKHIILPVTSRSGRNSTTYEKKFPGGYISLANANVVMDLSMKTCRFGVKDEVSKWQPLPNGADPETLFFGRFTAFRRQRTYKIFELSTPELDSGDELGDAPGHCRIDRSFRRSDQRYWNIPCPHCDREFVQSFDLLEIDRAKPENTVMRCPHCHEAITEMERVVAVRAGRFVATAEGPDRHPGFHVDAFCSLLMSYSAIVEDLIENEGRGEAGEKDFANLDLALPFQVKGNAPDHKRLMERREDYPENTVPEDGLIFTAGADVQHDGIYVEAVGFGQDRQSWTVAAEFLPGATDNPNDGAWLLLDEFRERDFHDAHGQIRTIDAMAVDAGDGNRVNQVLEYCRRRPRCYAIAGRHGRGVPAISVPTKKSVTRRGKRKRVGGAMAWPVGTWTLKAEFYGNLHKAGIAAGEAADPSGYCHFGKFLGEEFFLQITAEYFEQKMVNGRFHEEWKPRRRDNHFLDCRIYAMAMAELMGLSSKTEDDWAALREELYPSLPVDLLSAPPERAKGTAVTDPPATAPTDDDFEQRRNKWAQRGQ